MLPGGCSGFQYGLNIEDEPAEDDMVLEAGGLRLFVDPFSMQYLAGTEIDYVSTFQGSGFTFNNPNSSGGCGCGSRAFANRLRCGLFSGWRCGCSFFGFCCGCTRCTSCDDFFSSGRRGLCLGSSRGLFTRYSSGFQNRTCSFDIAV